MKIITSKEQISVTVLDKTHFGSIFFIHIRSKDGRSGYENCKTKEVIAIRNKTEPLNKAK